MARQLPGRAMTELTSLFRAQWATGMLPHIVFAAERGGAYFPGPEVWRGEANAAAPNGVATSGLTQPPLHAYAVWWIWRHAADREEAAGFVRASWPHLAAQQAFLERSRDLGGGGLAAVAHPWESGMDDSPAWDRPLDAVPARGSVHDRYIWLATSFRDAGYQDAYLRDEHPFAVEDPLFNAVWAVSAQALAELAPVAGADPVPYAESAERLRAALVDRLWDAERGVFCPRDLRAGRLVPVSTVGGFGPLLDPGLSGEIGAALVDLLESPRFMGAAGYPVPSCEIRAPEFDRARYWRGPSWVTANWLLWRAAVVRGNASLAETLLTGTLRLVRQAGFRECFDPFDGTGRGCRDFSSSAALALDLLSSAATRFDRV
jgi:hypothetical protein